MEYAIESAALFNPSMVPAIDQAGLPPGSVRFVMSLRATGEGHVSSIVFRRGVVDADGRVSVDPPGRYSRPLAAVVPDDFEKDYFVRELQALGAWTDHTQATMALLGDRVHAGAALRRHRRGSDRGASLRKVGGIESTPCSR